MKPLVFRVLLGFVSLVFAFLVLELVVRLVPSARGLDPSETWDRPNRLYYSVRECPWTQGTTNILRVAVIGDSFSTGQGVQPSDTFVARLESLLNLNTNLLPAEVRVWAKGGYSTEMELSFLGETIKWRPHLLILQVYLNDTEDAERWEELKQWRDEMLPRKPSAWVARLLNTTHVGRWIYVKIGHRHSDKATVRYQERTASPDYSGWQKFVAALKVFRESCDREQIKLVVAVFPLIGEVDRYRFDKIHERIHQVLKQEGIDYLDLLDEFRGKRPERLEVVPKLDGHPNEIAHRIASEAIFRFLLDKHFLDRSYEPQIQSRGRQNYWRRMDQHMNRPLDAAEEFR